MEGDGSVGEGWRGVGVLVRMEGAGVLVRGGGGGSVGEGWREAGCSRSTSDSVLCVGLRQLCSKFC